MKILEDTDTYKEWFIKNVENLVLSFESNVDQFKVKDERLLKTPKLIILWPEGLQNRLKMPDHPQNNSFLKKKKERLIEKTKSLYHVLQSNNLPL